MKKYSYTIDTFGCKANQYDSQAMAKLLDDCGHFYRAKNGEQGEIALINSCTVTSRSDRQLRQLIYQKRRESVKQKIVVSGCTAQTQYQRLNKMSETDLVIKNEDKFKIVNFLLQMLGNKEEEENIIDSFPPAENFNQRKRAYLKIQDGCNMKCSYCIIPQARGKSRSDSPENILENIKRLEQRGFAEVVLTGIHLGHYLNGGDNLLTLLGRIEENNFPLRLRLSSLDPDEISLELLNLIKESKTICPHLHLAIQSGADNVLAKMKRNYRRRLIREKLELIAEILPGCGLGADFIVGFPGEEGADQQQTIELIKKYPFSYLHIFPYSKRQGTIAATLEGQLTESTKKERVKELRQLAAEKQQQFLEKFIGKEIFCLFERKKEGKYLGTDRNYLKVITASDRTGLNIGREIKMLGEKVLNGQLLVASK